DSERVYLMLNKPAGYTCSAKDVHAANLVFQLIPERFGRLFTVGRLDRDSEGLLLLTNDGDFAQRLTHPSHEIYKRYYVECAGRFTTAIRRQLLDGMYDNGEFLRALNVEQVSVRHGACSLIFTLGEGRKREIRRLCKDVGLTVTLLRRIAVGQLEMDAKLTVGSWRIMSPNDCELALKPIEVPARPAPAEPPKPYWVKDKPERKPTRSPRGAHRDDDATPRGPASRGEHGDRRRARRALLSAASQPQHPWYEEEDTPAPEAEDPRPQRAPRGGRYHKDADSTPRGDYGRGGYRDDETPRRGGGAKRTGKKPSSPGTGDPGYRRRKPPRSWR
ncbi:MAG: rRNA pseudouridine synthase, partial [Victivallales bacterium]|nr:rRNA pseudouridine synthase [Victivallales bacterium]